MSRKKYSQAAAHRMARELDATKRQLQRAHRRYMPAVFGTELARISLGNLPAELSAIRTAARLGYGVAVEVDSGSIRVIAVDVRVTP